MQADKERTDNLLLATQMARDTAVKEADMREKRQFHLEMQHQTLSLQVTELTDYLAKVVLSHLRSGCFVSLLNLEFTQQSSV